MNAVLMPSVVRAWVVILTDWLPEWASAPSTVTAPMLVDARHGVVGAALAAYFSKSSQKSAVAHGSPPVLPRRRRFRCVPPGLPSRRRSPPAAAATRGARRAAAAAGRAAERVGADVRRSCKRRSGEHAARTQIR